MVVRLAFFGLVIFAIVLIGGCQTISPTDRQSAALPFTSDSAPIVLLVHGGAGSARPGGLPEQDEAAYRKALSKALAQGYEILLSGGTSLDAVEAALIELEDNPLFNAGRGSVLTAKGEVSMDASIMDGSNNNAGAVAGVHTIRHPIQAAKAVMQRSPHVMLSGAGAEEFARSQNLEMMQASWFVTQPRLEQLNRVQQAEQNKISSKPPISNYFGTVGAVALDRAGNLAAATSTGGMTNKKWGRIGDSPIIGAGTYAENVSCAVSATGWGEYFIRGTVARDICARIQWTGADAQIAGDQEIAEVVEAGGSGGVLVLTADGNYAFSFSTDLMFRGVRTQVGEEVAIFANHGNRQFTD